MRTHTRSLWRFTAAAIVLGWVIWIPFANADPGYSGFEAGGPRLQNHNTIVMESADLVFRRDGRNWQADLTYVLHNPSDEPVDISVAFPYQLGTDYISEYSRDSVEPPSLQPFEMRVDELVVETSDTGSMRIANVTWAPGQRRELQYNYTHLVDDRFEYHRFCYWQLSGATWAGTIGRASIAVQLPPEVLAVTSSIPATVDEQRWLRIQMVDWEPRRDLYIDLIDQPLADWYDYFNVCERGLRASPSSLRVIASTLSTLNTPGEECRPFQWDSEYNTTPSRYFCLMATGLDLPAEIAECASTLLATGSSEEGAPYLPVSALFEDGGDADHPLALRELDHEVMAEWVAQRIRNARRGHSELVRLPMLTSIGLFGRSHRLGVAAYDVWGPNLRIQAADLDGEPPWEARVAPWSGYESEATDWVVEGMFTGFGSVSTEEHNSIWGEFVVLRARSFRRERDARLAILLTPEENTPLDPLNDVLPWLTIVASIPARDEEAQQRSEVLVAQLQEAGFTSAEAFDSRRARRLFCCYVTVVGGRYASREEAAAALETLQQAGFSEGYVRRGW